MSRPTARAVRRRRHLALLLIVAATTLGLTACSGPTSDFGMPGQSPPTLEISQNVLNHYDQTGTLLWSMHAAAAQYYRSSEETHAQRVELRFPRSTGNLTVRADQLIFYQRSGNLAISGHIVGQDAEGLRFTTDAASWDDAARTLQGDGAVEVDRKELHLIGKGFNYDETTGRLSVGDATLTVELTPNGGS